MCEHGTLTEVETIRDGKRKIDSCISELVDTLNRFGIKTTGSCCGHGNDVGNILFDNDQVVIFFVGGEPRVMLRLPILDKEGKIPRETLEDEIR